jgi:hypothetical protein
MNPQLIQLTERALSQIEPMAAQDWAPAESIRRQLNWCLAFARGKEPKPAPGSFSMGLIATREFDMYGDQPELALLINQIQREVEGAV